MNNIQVCKGPGCKEWSSHKIVRELNEIREGLGLSDITISRVSCMGQCGGGTSVKLCSKNRIIKIREVEEVDKVLSALGVSEQVSEPVKVAC